MIVGMLARHHKIVGAVLCRVAPRFQRAPAACARTMASAVPPPSQHKNVAIPPLPEDAIEKMAAADGAYRAAYNAPIARPAEELGAYKKRLIYRSKQRGWLEVDLMLGTWAVKHIPALTEEECAQYEHVLNLETIDLFNMLMGHGPVPPQADNAICKRVLEYVKANPVTSPASYASIKKHMSN